MDEGGPCLIAMHAWGYMDYWSSIYRINISAVRVGGCVYVCVHAHAYTGQKYADSIYPLQIEVTRES